MDTMTDDPTDDPSRRTAPTAAAEPVDGSFPADTMPPSDDPATASTAAGDTMPPSGDPATASPTDDTMAAPVTIADPAALGDPADGPPPPSSPPGTPPPVGPPPFGGPDPFSAPGPGPMSSSSPSPRLRRRTDDRVVAGVAAGLGRYFEVDPVLFRVLFATTAFFGGVGIIAYLLAWALIPDQAAVDPPVDRLLSELRRRQIPFWLVAGAVVVVLWSFVFRVWRPWGVAPALLAGVIVWLAFRHRQPKPPTGHPGAPFDPPASWPGPTAGPSDPADSSTWSGPSVPPAPAFGPPSADPSSATSSPTDPSWRTDPTSPPWATPGADAGPDSTGPAPSPSWVDQTRAWRHESRELARARRHRNAPVRWGAFGLLVAAVGVLGVIDAVRGVPMADYGWAVLVVSVGALVIGGMMRRTPWLNLVWTVLALAIVVTFAGSRASLHDGSGDRLVAPHSIASLPAHVHTAFGQTTIDLTGLSTTGPTARTIHVRQGGGQVRIYVPSSMAVAVQADVRLGDVEVDGAQHGRLFTSRHVLEPGSTGSLLTVDVELAAGQVQIDHVSG